MSLASSVAGGASGTAAVGAHAPQAPSLFGAIFALLAVVALILAIAWVLKRLPGTGFRQAPGLRVVGQLAVGARERVVVVEVGGEQLLLGVAAGNVRRLHTLSEPLPAPPQPAGFADLLSRATRKP